MELHTAQSALIERATLRISHSCLIVAAAAASPESASVRSPPLDVVAGRSTSLRRRLGLLETTLSGVGIILGAGIYVLVGEVAGRSGNAVWGAFLIAAGMAALIGLSYAELASMFPRAGPLRIHPPGLAYDRRSSSAGSS
jgi:hypothetical protein